MKAFTVVMKILAAAAAVVGAIYIAATYGDKIVAWAKKMMANCPCCCKDAEEVVAEVEAEVEVAAEEPVAEEVAVEEVPAEEPAAEEAEPVADEADFEG